MASTWTELRRLQTRKTKLLAQIAFLQRCKQHNVNPQSTILRQQGARRHSRKVIANFSRKYTAAMIQDKLTQIDEISYEGYITHLKLAKESHPAQMDAYIAKLHYTMMKVSQTSHNKHNRKFNWLKKKNGRKLEEIKRTPEPVQFHNLTDITLTKEEQEVLELGPKYCFRTPIDFRNTITEMEDIIGSVPTDQKEYIRGKIAHTMKHHNQGNNRKDKQRISILRSIRKKPNLSVVKADKSHQIVLIHTDTYNEKLQDHIDKSKCKKIKKDPTSSIKNNMKKILKDPNFPKEIADNIIIPSNPQIPKLFGRIKLHKTDHPARPVVSRCTAATYQMEKIMYKLIAPLFKEHPHTISSTKQFIEKAKEVEITPDSKMFSLDVESLYPSTPIELALQVISNKLIESQQFTIAQVGSIMKALRLITQNNYFTHNGQIYKQEEGAPMGSPLSSILAEAVLQSIEKEALRKIGFIPLLYVRYVDDCYVIIKNSQNIEELTSALNSVNQNIKFTTEEENHSQLPFLDVMITRKEDRLTFEVYRKPSSPPIIIREDSKHPRAYKQAALAWYSKRAEEYTTEEEAKQKERDNIKNIAIKHGYNELDIPKVKRPRNQESTLLTTNEKTEFKYKTMTYIPQLSEKISHILKKSKIKIAHKCKDNVYDIIRKDRENSNQLEQEGIYKIPIADKDGNIVSNYIGLTTRSVQERAKEHQKEVHKGNPNNAIARFTLNNNKMEPQWSKVTIIAKHRSKAQIHIREGIEIQHSNIPLCNIEAGLNIPTTWNYFLGPKTFTTGVT